MAELNRKSRYFDADLIEAEIYEVNDPIGQEPVRIDLIFGQRFTSYERPDNAIDYVTQPGDTMTNLALRFFGDASLWWIIADFNFEKPFYPLDLEPDTALVIPPPEIAGLITSQL